MRWNPDPREGSGSVCSPSRADLRLTFFDGSWVRLTTGSRRGTERIVRYVNGELRPLRECDLTPAQREAIGRNTVSAAKAFKVGPERLYAPYYAALGEGYVEAHVPYPSKVFGHVDTFPVRVGPDGRKGAPPSDRG